ncbi:SDR family oxidoreductase [Sphingobacterium spiritivorum]|uniref:SDR family oxidoreductase n=1 Tax=Sphingobacterium spiritivorum TaxID=258 RepID=UPI003DA48B9A
MKISLIGKTAMVGGSTSGIGKAIAIALADCGAHVILVARNGQKLKTVQDILDTTHGQQHDHLVVDFSLFEQAKDRIAAFFSGKKVDILVNNTNGPSAGGIREKATEDYQQAFDLLFQYTVYTTLQALPHMETNQFGRIINVSSMTVKEPQDTLVLSNTMRTALVSWSKSLSRAVAAHQITVNTVLTGYFDTDRLNSLMEIQAGKMQLSFEEVKAKRVDAIPMKRLGKPEEYASLVAFLASDHAAYLTGTAIQLDGGLMTGML